jgi:hypothetical protein
MLLIEDYVQLTKADRQAHLDLSAPCIERGGPEKGGLSSYCKGLMAHLLDTTIPSGHKIHVCHACNNAKCSNPAHLYWGSASENSQDRMVNNGATIWEQMVKKHGLEKARAMNAKGKTGNTYGNTNKGKPKSEEQKKKLSESGKRDWEKRKIAQMVERSTQRS